MGMKFFRILFLLPLVVSGTSSYVMAASSSTYSSVPANISSTSAPMVMINMSNDHQLFTKAYDDYSDLNGDNVVDTTYKDDFKYVGYFDSTFCYTYQNSRFEPTAAADSNYHCSGTGDWSGNMLNWASMSRLDVVRSILYGGKRSTDTTSATVLERAFIPADSHAWSKVLVRSSNSDLKQLVPDTVASSNTTISFCNVTLIGGTISHNSTAAPLLRVASGDVHLWDVQPGYQCQWYEDHAGASAGQPQRFPSTSTRLHSDMNVRVKVCDSSATPGVDSFCSAYVDGSNVTTYKPTGLLQEYGEDGSMLFGLITGTYNKNNSGGVLRKAVGNIGGEINSDNGIVSSNGIISSIDAFTIVNYQEGYTGYANDGGCNWNSNFAEWTDGQCRNWGNPVGEMYLEALRYFSGSNSGTSAFIPSSFFSYTGSTGLTTGTWGSPYTGAQECSSANVIAFSGGSISFDNDGYSSVTDVNGLSTALLSSVVTGIGTREGISGNYFIGSNGVSTPDQLCSAKNISDLDDVHGLCPDAGGLEGSYNVAGLSYLANIRDLDSSVDGTQSVTTYAVSLTPPIPTFTITHNGKTAEITPTAINYASTGHVPRDTNMALVKTYIVSQTANSGIVDVSFEDMVAGSDHDEDMLVRYKYEVTGADKIKVTTYLLGASGSYFKLSAGYTISGVTTSTTEQVVIHNTNGGSYSSTESDVDTLCPGTAGSAIDASCTTGNDTRLDVSYYDFGTSTVDYLENPLWYAAKWGGFKDAVGGTADIPDSQSEWDSRNNSDGTYAPDGIPDNYFLVSNPSTLESQLRQVLQSVLSRVSSSTAAAVISNSTTGEGAVYQALYQPSYTSGGKSISWQGILHSLFIDSNGFLREDTNGNGTLDGYFNDSIVELYYDANVGRTLIQRYATSDDGATVTKSGLPAELTDLKTLWNASDRLSALTNLTTQRNYATTAANGRYIVTTTGSDGADADTYPDLIAFDTTNFATGGGGYEERLLGTLPAGLSVSNLVNYIRGQEISGLRNRTIDYDGDGTDEVWRLGDIVHSTPLVVGQPNARYGALYNDTSYTNFKTHYKDRRHVIYVGANDGMLHAFNAGFWNSSTKGYQTSLNGEVQHPLGSELWAYIPKPALPHLQWLTEEDYPHVYYVDGIPQSYDVNIFTPDTDHPDGWGTILVVGMRLGGGEIQIDSDGDSVDDETLSSVYMIFDITNPENPPELIAELSPTDQGFATSRPMIIKNRVPVTNATDWTQPNMATNNWFLMFGSGPNDQTTVTSNRDPDVYLYNLATQSMVTLHSNAAGSTDFFGDPGVVDWDLDYVDDYAYMGTVGGNASSPTGDIYRIKLNDNQITSNKWSISTFADLNDPVSQRPTFAKDQNDDQWLFLGSGRFFSLSDNTSTQQHYLYGLKEPRQNNGNFTYGTIDRSDLLDVSGATVYTNGAAVVPSDNSINTFANIVTKVEAADGWYNKTNYNGSDPSGRVLGRAALVNSAVVFAEYEPNADLCSPEGTSYLHGLYFATGTASTDIFLGSTTDTDDADGDSNTTETVARSKVTLGQGLVTDPVIHKSEGGVQVITQGSTGAFIRDTTQDKPTAGTDLNVDGGTGGRQSWREVILK
jgi:type IV pilus assembly protein PilY1